MKTTPDNIPIINFENLYLQDPLADSLWSYWLGEKNFKDLREHFVDMGRSGAQATPFSARADSLGPILKTHTPQGQRQDLVEYHPDYHQLEKLSYGAGIISRKYDPAFLKLYRPLRHLVGFGIGYYFAQTEIGLYCPICMTDGVGRVLERHGPPEVTQTVLKHIGSKQLESLWQGAMFLTEKQGGSDVGANTAQARKSGDRWLISGDKWFCSKVDAEAILVLARMPEDEGRPETGTRGLGLFLVLRHLPPKNHRHLQIHRLKQKMGVRSMPSGEVTMENAEGFLIGGAGEGFKLMAEMLNMSRLYNSVASIAGMRRAIMEALAYGAERKAFDLHLRELPLWRANMADLVAEHIGAMHLVFSTAQYLDHADGGDKTAQLMVRLLTPITKAFTGKLAIFAASESMEAIGGNAYIEEHIMPRILRDCQVLPIWEGTTNILSLDALRVLRKYGHQFYYTHLAEILESCSFISPAWMQDLKKRLSEEQDFLGKLLTMPDEDQQRSIREWVERTARSLSLIKLLQSSHETSLKAIMDAAYQRLVLRPTATSPLGAFHTAQLKHTEEILLKAGYQA